MTLLTLSLCVVFFIAVGPGVASTCAQGLPKPKPTPDVIDELKRKYGIKSAPTPMQRPPNALTARQVVERVMPSIVLIVAQDENEEPVGQGSGFFFKPGLVATNLHVFKRASQGYIKIVSSGQTHKIVEVVSLDVRRDICVIRVADATTRPLPLNASIKPAIGDEVYVLSNPKGLEGSVSKGIVSALRNDIGLIQIDAAISPGSSGGAVVDDRGEVIGLAVSSLISGQNLNFAIPSQFLNSLESKFRVPVFVAGAFALNDRTKEQLKGLVREIVETQGRFGVDQRGGYYEEPRVLSDKKVFDINGNKIEDWEYLDGKLFWKHLNSFDANGFLTRKVMEFRDGERKTYEYTLQESMSKRLNDRQFSDVDETPNYKSIFDRDGNEVEASVKLTDGTTTRWVKSYDKHGFVVEQKTYKSNTLESVSRYKYEVDDNGNWIKRVETSFSHKYPSLGFTPDTNTYREIKYY